MMVRDPHSRGTGVPPVFSSGGTGVPPVIPSGGTGVPPVFSEKITRRHLPHWQLAGVTYFLTWRCAAGVTLTEVERDIVLAAIRHWDATRWNVFAAVVMPDHVHALVCPLPKGDGRWELGELLHSIKSYSAHQIAKVRSTRPAARGSTIIWQDERYDRWMRDEEEFAETWGYIVGNPVRAGLAEVKELYRWLYQKTGETPVPREEKTGETPVPREEKTGGTPVPPI